MTEAQYIKRMKQHEATFDRLWEKIIVDTNKFVEKNPEKTFYSFKNNIEKFTDSLCLSGAWIEDRINSHGDAHPRGRTKKISRALGYSLP